METRDQANWSIGLGRWAGASIRAEWLLVFFVLASFVAGWHFFRQNFDEPFVGLLLAAGGLCILLASIFVHEVGHFVACHRAGGHISVVRILPWGGDNSTYIPTNGGRIFTYLAGPAANLLAAAVVFVMIHLGLKQEFHWEFLHPLRPPTTTAEDKLVIALNYAFWINWLLFLINLLPGRPFDGGYALPAAIRSIHRGATATQVIQICSLVTWTAAAGFFVAAFLFVGESNTHLVFPYWDSLVLVALAVALFFSSRLYARESMDPKIEDWSVKPTYLDEVHDARSYLEDDFYDEDDEDSISDWLHERQQDRERMAREVEEEEEQRMDEILKQVHRNGIESLSEEDRAILQRVSARYRRRPREEQA